MSRIIGLKQSLMKRKNLERKYATRWCLRPDPFGTYLQFVLHPHDYTHYMITDIIKNLLNNNQCFKLFQSPRSSSSSSRRHTHHYHHGSEKKRGRQSTGSSSSKHKHHKSHKHKKKKKKRRYSDSESNEDDSDSDPDFMG